MLSIASASLSFAPAMGLVSAPTRATAPVMGAGYYATNEEGKRTGFW